MNVIIIEDEPLIADALRFEIKKAAPNVKIIKVLGSIEEALGFFKHNPLPDLFFSDIELPDGLSFSIFKTLDLNVPVIFCTAYDHYALKAFNANGVDYILKPFNSNDIKSTFEKIEKLQKNPGKIEIVEDIIIKSAPKSILIKKGDTIFPIKTTEINLVHIENGITYLYTKSLTKITHEETLENMQNLLGNDFFKINRQNLVHRELIESASNYFGRKLKLNCKINLDFDLIVAKNNVSTFLSWLANN